MSSEQILTSIPPQDLLNRFSEEFRKIVREEISQFAAPPPPEELITRKAAAAMLGITLPTLLNYTKEGKIPVYRIGSRIRYKRHEVTEAAQRIKKYGRQL